MEHKNLEQDLKEIEERFRSTFEQAAVGIVHIASDGTFLKINQRFCEIVKYSYEEMLSRTFNDITHPEDLHKDLTFINLMLMGKIFNYSLEKRCICGDGSMVWVNLTVSLVHDEAGEPKYFISVVEDISEKKAAEIKLQESEENYRLFIENFQGIAFKGYRDFEVIFFQGAVEKITGYNEIDFTSGTIRWDELIHPQDLPRVKKLIDEFFDSPENSTQREYRIIDKNREIHWVLESIQKIYDDSNNKEGVQGTIIDITDKKEAEELVLEEIKKLTELNRVKVDLLNRVSHELKTPLNAILGSVQLLMEDLQTKSDFGSYRLAENIFKGGSRLKKIVSELVESSKFEWGRIKLNKQKENLTQILKECIEELMVIANKRRVFISVDLGENIFFELDWVKIEQAIINLITNAINNTPPEGKVSIKLVDNNGYIDISIKDTGIGLTEEEKGKLFTKFGKIERYGKKLEVDIDGLGLGLYISKEIVQLHGGQILVNSAGRNKGAEFIIRLPKSK
ncbi:MAG: PAS domain S-box protein [Promethearchaeota archaeon]